MNKFEQNLVRILKNTPIGLFIARLGMAILKAQALDDLEKISKDPDVLAAIRKNNSEGLCVGERRNKTNI